MSAGAYLVKGTDPSLRDRVVDDLVAELLGDDDRTLALEEIVIPGRAGPGEESDATAGAEGREAAVAALLNAAGQPAVHDRAPVVVVRATSARSPPATSTASSAISTTRSTPPSWCSSPAAAPSRPR